MSFANYSPLATFWSTVKRAVGTQLITAADLYDSAILRVADNTAWLNAEITRRFAVLASTTAGTPGKVTGSVDLTTLIYDPTAGDLNSKTFAVQSNNSGLITVTFGTGAGVAPTGPADVVIAINNATTSNPLASVDAAGHLSIASTTTGGTGTATVQSGSAVTPLGFTNGQNNTGVSTGGDGASAIGVPALTGTSFSTSASTLHVFLQGLVNAVATLSGSNTWTGLQTFGATVFGGAMTMSGSGGTLSYRTTQYINAAATAANIDASHDQWASATPSPAGNVLTITVKHTGTVPPDGFPMNYSATTLGINQVILQREDATVIVAATGGSFFGARMRYDVALTKWKLSLYSGDGTLLLTAP